LPIAKPVWQPRSLSGDLNGSIPDAELVPIFGMADARVQMHSAAARSLTAFCQAFALGNGGKTLTFTSRYDVYRPYSAQVSGFVNRYEPCSLTLYSLTPSSRRKRWPDDARKPSQYQGKTYWRKKRNADGSYPATIATPGTSNHGWGLAIDLALGPPGVAGSPLTYSAVEWMRRNVQRMGFSYESQSENWHIRLVVGDHITLDVHKHEQASRPTLKRGDKDTVPGGQVWQLQKMLNAAGASPLLAADGQFGPKTEAAVKARNAAHGVASVVATPLTTWAFAAYDAQERALAA
jgi:hypothetical protein